MVRKLFLPTILVFASSVASAAPSMRLEPRAPDRVSGGGLPSVASVWLGGPVSLPYNVQLPWQTIRDRAQSLGCAQPALEEFDRRGYIRRADKDSVFTSTGVSCAVLAYEKPGHAITERQPAIIVTTFAREFEDGWWPTTMVGGMVVRDSVVDGTHLPAICLEDPADAVLSVARFESLPGNGPLWDTPVFGGYSAREILWSETWRYASRMSDEERNWWNEALRIANVNAVQGAVTGFSAGLIARNGTACILGLCIGWGSGGLNGILEYMKSHPYPKRP